MATTLYLWSLGDCTADLSSDGTVITSYTRAPNHAGEIISQTLGGTTLYYHCDAFGATRVVTDATQTTVRRFGYSFYGAAIYSTGMADVPFRFMALASLRYCSITDSYLSEGNDYVPSLARWANPRPSAKLFGANKYQFVTARIYKRAAEADRPILSYSTDDRRTKLGNCGAVRWSINWSVSGNTGTGVIVQFMQVVVDCCNCLSAKDGRGCCRCNSEDCASRWTYNEYTEMWPVVFDEETGESTIYAQYCRKGGQTIAQRSSEDIWCFRGCDPNRYNRSSCGGISYVGNAFYLPWEDVEFAKYSYPPGGFQWAGCLISARDWDYTLFDIRPGNSVLRTWNVDWNCCGPGKKCCETQHSSETDDVRSYERLGCNTDQTDYSCPSDFQRNTECRCAHGVIVEPRPPKKR